MPDFETLPIGTQKEIELSRELTKAITQLISQYGDGIIPRAIALPYYALKDHRSKNN
jgi:hypothetical protein